MAKLNELPVVRQYTTPYTCHFVASSAEVPYSEYISGYHGGIEPNVPVIEGQLLPEDGVIELGDEPGFWRRLGPLDGPPIVGGAITAYGRRSPAQLRASYTHLYAPATYVEIM